jgi:hypothetical protein
MYISKHITTALIGILALGAGYLIIGQTHPSISDEMKLNTGSITISQSGIETDTGKRLMTLAQSGTQWGMSPFGSGKPLTEEKKPEFKKPNTEWKSRSVTLIDGMTLYYEFGKGNPAGVALNKDQINAMTKTCEGNTSLMEKGICNAESGLLSYVTPEVENHILLALSDPNWSKLATVCEKAMHSIETSDLLANAKLDTNVIYYDKLFTPGFLDIDTFISVDQPTGWKKLNIGKASGLVHYLMCSMKDGCRGEDLNINSNCVDHYGSNIVRHLETAVDLYHTPLSTSN